MNELISNNPNRPLKIAMVVDSWDIPFNGTVVSTQRFVAALSEEFNLRIFIIPQAGIQHDERFVAFPRLRLPGTNDLMQSMNTPLTISNQKKILEALPGCDLVHIQYPFFLAGATIRAARKLGIQTSIGRLNQQHPERWYASTDLFVQSSQVELEGMSVMDAMASIICALASDAQSSAPRDFMVGDNTHFRSGDTLDLAEKLNFWIANRDQLNIQGQKKRQMVAGKTHHYSAQRLSEIYRQTYATAKPHVGLIHE